MKISKETIDILQNFSTINQSMMVLGGTKQKTLSPLKTGYAEADIAESFPKDFAVFDLSMFLGIMSLFKEPDIDFSDTAIIISEGTHKATYRFCNSSLIVFPPKDKRPEVGPIAYSFELSADNLKLLTKAVSLYNHEHICIEADGDGIFVKTLNLQERDSDGMSYRIGDTDQKFRYVVKMENLKLMPHSYDVSIAESRKVVFNSKNMELTYIVPCEAV